MAKNVIPLVDPVDPLPTPRQGTAVYRKGQRKLREILNCAEGLLIDEGLVGFSMRKVAARAGLSLAALQHYFPTSRELFQAVCDHLFRTDLTVQNEFLQNIEGDATDKLAAFIQYIVDDNDNPDTMKLYTELDSISQRDEFVAVSMRQMYSSYVHELGLLIRAVDPVADEQEITRRASLALGLMDGVCLYVLPNSRLAQGNSVGLYDEVIELAMNISLGKI